MPLFGCTNSKRGWHMSAARQSQKKQGTNKEFLAAQWQPGQSGNPAGRPPGSRNQLAESFLRDALADWEENGKAAFAKLATDKPDIYLEMMGKIAEPVAATPVNDARPVFDIGVLLGAIAGAGAARSTTPALPDRSVLAAEVRAEPSGRRT